ncbi:MAG: FecR family protein [Methylacidiphilales bacterium]|nr:FecR family protein [Candidatus Methylacidiphilales bacterium]
MKSIHYLLLAGALAFACSNAFSATQLHINGLQELEIANQDGKLINSLTSGSISQLIKSDNQAFKVSYGKDLKGRQTVILYPDPAKPQSISVNFMGQDINLSPDSVLTIVIDKSATIFQAGILGTISVGGQTVASGTSVQLQNGAVVSASTAAPAPEPPSAPPSLAPKITKIANQEAPPAPVAAGNFTGPTVLSVQGDAFIAPPGKDVVQVVNESAIPPRISKGAQLTPGNTIQTGPNSTVIITPFPGTQATIQPNTTVTLDQMAYTPGASVERKFHANLKSGSVFSNINGFKPGSTSYEIETPFGVAAARGTIFNVTYDGIKFKIEVVDGHVRVTNETTGKTYDITVNTGEMAVITKDIADGKDPATVTANLERVLDSFQTLFAPRLNDLPITPTTP